MSINNKREKFIRRDELGRRTGRVTSREKKKFEQLLNTGMDYAAIGRATDRDPRTVEKYLEFKNDKSTGETGESEAIKEQISLHEKAEQLERARQKEQSEKEQKIIDDANRAKENQKIIDDTNRAIKEQIDLHEKAEQKERARQKHLDSLNKIAGQLRNRIINPEKPYQSYRNTSTWQWGKQDWRFSCAAWFSIMTPRLDDEELLELDFPGFNYLEQHIATSPFWSTCAKLDRECTSLDDDIDKAVEILKTGAPSAYEKFIDYKSFLDDFHLGSAYSPKRKPSVKEITPLNSEAIDFLQTVFQIFTACVPDYKKRLDELENLLQQLWDDLDPDKIEEMIEQGSCSSPKCFPRL